MLPIYTYPMRNMVPNLVYSARGCEVALAAVDGEIIMRDGKFTRINAEDYLAAIPQYPDNIGRRAAKEFFEIDGFHAGGPGANGSGSSGTLWAVPHLF